MAVQGIVYTVAFLTRRAHAHAGVRERSCGTTEDRMYVAPAKRLTTLGARKMLETAIGIAERERIPICVAIVDAGGHLMLLERMEGGRFHTVHSSTTKAVCASSNKR